MKKKKISFFIALILFLILGYSLTLSQNQKCLICHGKTDFSVSKEDGVKKKLFVDENLLKNSIHKDKKCQDCHSDIVEISATGHKKNVLPVNCIRCHFEGNPVNAPQTEKYFEYQKSVHGMALASGNPKAPRCQSCHGSHYIQKGRSEKSNVYKLNVSKICGSCHLNEYTEFKTSIHGDALEKGSILDVPGCPDCHGEHNIRKIADSSSTVSQGKLANTCSRCHAAAALMLKYGIESKRLETYKESFHGISVEFGEKKAASCASCHGVHLIKPATDPTSSIYPANIPKTCGKCHPDANANYAKGKIHIDPKDPGSGPIYYISSFFKYLTITTLIALFIHIFLDLARKIKHNREAKKNA